MWRRLLSSNLKTLAAAAAAPTRSTSIHTRSLIPPSASASLFNLRHFAAYFARGRGAVKKRRVYEEDEDPMPVYTPEERAQLPPELQLSVVNYPCGPFGTKEKPAIIKSYYDKRIVGCRGGEGPDEHDFVFFTVEKGKPRKCPVCPQYLGLKVVGPGGLPDGHGNDDHHH